MFPYLRARPALATIGALALCAGCSTSAQNTQATTTPTSSSTPSATVPSAELPTSTTPGAPTTKTSSPQKPPAGDGRASSTVVITSTNWNKASRNVEVSGYVPVVESDGRCTLALQRNGLTKTTQSTGNPDASSTSCGRMTIPGSQLSPGRWTAVITYLSKATRAASSPATVEVP